MFKEQPKRKVAILLALTGFYLTSSPLAAIALCIIGGFCYLSLVLHPTRQPSSLAEKPQIPATAPSPLPVVKRTLHFMPGLDPQLVIKQNAQKTATSQQTSANTTNTPNSSHRVKI